MKRLQNILAKVDPEKGSKFLGGLLYIAIAAVTSLFVALLLSIVFLFTGDFSLQTIWKTFVFMFMLIGGYAAAGVVVWFTNLEASWHVPVGCVLYYGTLLGGRVFSNFMFRESDACFLAFVILALVIALYHSHKTADKKAEKELEKARDRKWEYVAALDVIEKNIGDLRLDDAQLGKAREGYHLICSLRKAIIDEKGIDPNMHKDQLEANKPKQE